MQLCSMKEDLADSRSSVRLRSVQSSRRRARRSLRPVRLCCQSDRVHSRWQHVQAVSARWICVSHLPRVRRALWSTPLGRHCCITPRYHSPPAAHLVRTTYVLDLRVYFSCIVWQWLRQISVCSGFSIKPVVDRECEFYEF